MGDFLEILRVLVRHEVKFVIVGGVCAVLNGAPVTTFDLDLVHDTSRANAERLRAALSELDGWFREHPRAKLRPSSQDLQSPGHALLMTCHGPLDLLGRVTGNRGYAELIDSSEPLQLEEGLWVHLLDLETLILLKEEMGREKDRVVLPILRKTLLERGS